MRIIDLYNYKDAYKIYKIFLNKNHPNIIIYGKDNNKKIFIETILNELFNIKISNKINNEFNYEYNDYYYYFNIKNVKVDSKDIFFNTLQKICNSYNYYHDKHNYIILDNYDKINPIIENKLKVIIEKSTSTSKYIILTNMIDKILEAVKSRCLLYRLKLLNYNDKYCYVKKYIDKNNIVISEDKLKLIIESNNDINIIKNHINGYENYSNILLKKIINILNSKLNKNLLQLKDLCYNIKNSVIDISELIKLIVNYFIVQDISNDKKKKIIKSSTHINYLMINCYKDIIYLEYYLLDLYNIIND